MKTDIPIEWVGWAAGIFEGEGSVVCGLGKNQKRSAGVKLTVAQKDFEGEPSWVLFKLKEMYGGSVTNDGKTGMHKWTCFSETAREFILSIEPFLSPRRLKRINELRLMAKESTEAQRGGRKTFWWRT